MDLTKLLNNGDENHKFDGLDAFDKAEAAPEWKPLPAGIYTARIVSGELTQTKKGDDGYRVVFEIVEGEQRGKRISRLWTFTPKAVTYAKRDLATFGLTCQQHLLEPFPPVGREYIMRLRVAQHQSNDGTLTNDIKRIDVLRIEESHAADFLIDPNQSEGGLE